MTSIHSVCSYLHLVWAFFDFLCVFLGWNDWAQINKWLWQWIWRITNGMPSLSLKTCLGSNEPPLNQYSGAVIGNCCTVVKARRMFCALVIWFCGRNSSLRLFSEKKKSSKLKIFQLCIFTYINWIFIAGAAINCFMFMISHRLKSR